MKDVLIICLLVLVIVFSCLPLFKNIQNINLDFDWLQMASYYRADRQAILEFRQFPFRTFYFGGGYPLAANPQDGSLNPFFLPPLLFGEVIGIKVNVFLAHLVALLGMFYLCRGVMKYNLWGASFSALVFCLGGHLHRLLIRGQDYIPSFYFFFVPLLLALFIKTKEGKKFFLFAALLLAVIISQAGLYLAPILLFIFLFSFLEAFRGKDNKLLIDPLYLKNFFIVLFLALFLAAVKVLPCLELLVRNPRTMAGYNPFWPPLLPNIYRAFFVPVYDFPFPGLHWNYFYLGVLPVACACLTFIMDWKKAWRGFVLLFLFFLLAFSGHTRFDIFQYLWQLPLFHSIEAPTRYFVSLVLFLIALYAGKVFSIADRIKNRFIVFVFAGVIVFTVVDLLRINTVREDTFSVPVPFAGAQPAFFPVRNSAPGGAASPLIPKKMFLTRSWEWTRPTQYELMLQNIGKINWYGNIHLGEYAVPKYFIQEDLSLRPNPGYRGEAYFLNDPKNTARLHYFSPNKIVVNVRIEEPDILIINQNYDKYWASDKGKPSDANGLLGLPLKEGEYLVTFAYIPVSFYVGLVLSIITAVGMIYLL